MLTPRNPNHDSTAAQWHLKAKRYNRLTLLLAGGGLAGVWQYGQNMASLSQARDFYWFTGSLVAFASVYLFTLLGYQLGLEASQNDSTQALNDQQERNIINRINNLIIVSLVCGAVFFVMFWCANL